MMNGVGKPHSHQIPVPESKVAAESETPPSTLEEADVRAVALRRKSDFQHALLRLFSLLTAVISLSMMIVAEQSATLVIYGFHLPISSKWTYADSFEFLVGMSTAAAAYSLSQLVVSGVMILKRSPVIPSRKHAWFVFFVDQAFAFAVMSAASASAGVTNLNRTGIKHAPLPDFCKPLDQFCRRAGISIGFALITCLLLAASSVMDVVWLSKY